MKAVVSDVSTHGVVGKEVKLEFSGYLIGSYYYTVINIATE